MSIKVGTKVRWQSKTDSESFVGTVKKIAQWEWLETEDKTMYYVFGARTMTAWGSLDQLSEV